MGSLNDGRVVPSNIVDGFVFHFHLYLPLRLTLGQKYRSPMSISYLDHLNPASSFIILFSEPYETGICIQLSMTRRGSCLFFFFFFTYCFNSSAHGFGTNS